MDKAREKKQVCYNTMLFSDVREETMKRNEKLLHFGIKFKSIIHVEVG